MEKQVALNFEMLQTVVIGKNTTVPPKIVLTKEMMERIRDLCYMSKATFIEEKQDDTVNTYVFDVDSGNFSAGPISNSKIDQSWIKGYYKDGYIIPLKNQTISQMKRTVEGYKVTLEVSEKVWIIPVRNGQMLYPPQIHHKDQFKVCLSNGMQLFIYKSICVGEQPCVAVKAVPEMTTPSDESVIIPLIFMLNIVDIAVNSVSVCLATSDKLFIAMNDYLYCWNVAEESMMRVKRDKPATNSSVVQLRDGTIMVVGGYFLSDLSRDIDIYDPDTMQCVKQSKMLIAIDYPICACLPNGNVLISACEPYWHQGPRVLSGVFRHFELYDPEENICRSVRATGILDVTWDRHQSLLVFPVYGQPIQNMIRN